MAKKAKKTKKRAKKAKRPTKKKKVVRRKKAVPRRPKKKAVKAPSKAPKLPSEPIGHVTHYFPKVGAAAVLIERQGIRAGDTLYFKGHTTNFKQAVASLQINHLPVQEGSVGEEVGIQVKSRTREHDLVFKL